MTAASPKINTVMGAFEWMLLLLLAALWGGSFFLSKVAVAEVAPFTLVLFRVATAAIVLLAYLLLSGRGIPGSAAAWRAFLIMGLINNVLPFSLLFWGQTMISGSLASILNATTPIFTVVIAHYLTGDEQITRGKVMGILLGFVGVAVMLGGGLTGVVNNPVIAMVACLGAALSYGLAASYGRRFAAMGIGPARVAFGQLTASSLVMVPVVLLMDPPISIMQWSGTTLSAVIVLGVVCTALAYILFFRILSSGGATNISLVTLLVPVSAILLGSAFLGERLSPLEFTGMGLIALALVTIDGRVFSIFRNAKPVT